MFLIDLTCVGLFFTCFVVLIVALNCLDYGYSCQNGGKCVPRVLGDYVCSCPQPHCGFTCTNLAPQCKQSKCYMCVAFLIDFSLSETKCIHKKGSAYLGYARNGGKRTLQFVEDIIDSNEFEF